MNKDAFEKILKISEEFFGTENDPDQMPITNESADKLRSIHPDTLAYIFDGENNPIAWAVVVPTSVGVMNSFLNKKITERELLDMATEEKNFESLYISGVFVLPEYRRMGHALKLLKDSIEKISDGKTLPLYSWAYSKEGGELLETLSKDLGRPIILIEE